MAWRILLQTHPSADELERRCRGTKYLDELRISCERDKCTIETVRAARF
jgi:hypothetical protein